MRRDLVVIGASAGGIDAIRAIVAGLGRDFPAAICAVIHTAAESPGVLDKIIAAVGTLKAVTVRTTERIRPGTVYVSPPDHHLIVEPSVARATRGPRENRFRPAVDPLFRSAAQTYGPRAIGVILTGGLDDGTAGLWAIKQLGGVAIVQDPANALAASMPQNALAHVDVDHCLPLERIAPLLRSLVDEDIAEQGGYTVPEPMRIEVKIAGEAAPLEAGVEKLGDPSTYACPECHGVLRSVKEGDRVRFRCHTGHAYSMEALISEFDSAIDTALWTSVRALQEKVILFRSLAEDARHMRDDALARSLATRADETLRRAELVRIATLAAPDAEGVVETPLPPAARGGNGRSAEPSE
jgi:two-component system chemotaxis response regulator CheB